MMKQNSLVDAKTLNYLLHQERKDVLNYVSKNMQEILLGFQKIDKFCAINLSKESEVMGQSVSCSQISTRTERFPTRLTFTVPGKFPSFIEKTKSETSTCPISENSDSE